MEKITTWINKNNSFIAWAGLFVLPAIAWWLNTKWPNAENIIAISAALIGIAPAIYIEFSRRANEEKGLEEKRKSVLHKVLSTLYYMENILKNQQNVVDKMEDSIKSYIKGGCSDKNVKVYITEVDFFIPDMLKMMLHNSEEIFHPNEFKELVVFCSQYEMTQKIVKNFITSLEEHAENITPQWAGNCEAECKNTHNIIQVDINNISNVIKIFEGIYDTEIGDSKVKRV